MNHKVRLDADGQGEWSGFLEDYREWFRTQLNLGLITGEEAADVYYRIGFLKCAVINNRLRTGEYEELVNMQREFSKYA